MVEEILIKYQEMKKAGYKNFHIVWSQFFRKILNIDICLGKTGSVHTRRLKVIYGLWAIGGIYFLFFFFCIFQIFYYKHISLCLAFFA